MDYHHDHRRNSPFIQSFMSRYGNSMIPSDKQYDEYYAIRCEDCNVKLNTEELKRGDPYLCDICFESEQETKEEE